MALLEMQGMETRGGGGPGGRGSRLSVALCDSHLASRFADARHALLMPRRERGHAVHQPVPRAGNPVRGTGPGG